MRRGGEWMRLGFTIPVGTGGIIDVCLCCSGVCGVGGYGAWNRVWKSGMVFLCESGFFV